MANRIDAGEHLRLAHRVIGQMGLRGDIAEEAFSESLVLITEAAISYDESRNVPLANWLARNIRWGISKWLDKQKPVMHMEEDFVFPERTENFTKVIEYRELLGRLSKLTLMERTVVLSEAFGYKGIEVAKRLGISPVSVSKIKRRARRKLNANA